MSPPKGLFDAIDAVALANQQAPAGIRIDLTVAGSFWNDSEKKEFEQRLSSPDLLKANKPLVQYVGFANGADKKRLFMESDCFCFPTYYPAESFGLVLLEAMAYGLPIVASRWRMVPELLPPNYSFLVEPQCPKELCAALLKLCYMRIMTVLCDNFLNASPWNDSD